MTDIKCPSCGNENAATNRFCIICGCEIKSENNHLQEPQNTEKSLTDKAQILLKSSQGKWIVIGTLAVLLVCVFVLFSVSIYSFGFDLLSTHTMTLSGNGSGVKLPLFSKAKNVKMDSIDQENLMIDLLRETGYSHFLDDDAWVDISWTKAPASVVIDELDDIMPRKKWRLQEDWSPEVSLWKYGDYGALIFILGELDSEIIKDLERTYGVLDLEEGVTLIITYAFSYH